MNGEYQKSATAKATIGEVVALADAASGRPLIVSKVAVLLSLVSFVVSVTALVVAILK